MNLYTLMALLGGISAIGFDVKCEDQTVTESDCYKELFYEEIGVKFRYYMNRMSKIPYFHGELSVDLEKNTKKSGLDFVSDNRNRPTMRVCLEFTRPGEELKWRE